MVHIVQIDLTAPGIGLFVTPLDPEAVSRGYQYRLADATAVLRRDDLAVVVNGVFFSADSGLFYHTGDLANGIQTVIADGVISQEVDHNSCMLWFEPGFVPQMESGIVVNKAALRRARWGIGGVGGAAIWKGQVQTAGPARDLDRRTAIGIDSRRRLLWLAVFENASSLGVAEALKRHGVQDGFLLDGGHSTTMVLGPKAAHVRSGSLIGGSRPVATVLGIRADPL